MLCHNEKPYCLKAQNKIPLDGGLYICHENAHANIFIKTDWT